jgi:hypothetical protein
MDNRSKTKSLNTGDNKNEEADDDENGVSSRPSDRKMRKKDDEEEDESKFFVRVVAVFVAIPTRTCSTKILRIMVLLLLVMY